ncbi:MAG: type IV pilus assembly protein PilM [Armatimonadetes bacterium]|nr:type IV pilus assembly protein PilM [Armatimonadota bacterium]
MAKGATHVLGLDIGTEAIKAVELKLDRGEIRLVGRPVIVPTPTHSVSGGRVVDSAAVVEALDRLLSSNGFSTKKVVASVGGDTDVVVRIIEVPKMTGKELDEAIQWELERQAPFPVDQAVFDYQPIERPDTPPDAQNMEVLLAVAQEEMVDAHVEALMAAKLVPQAIDVEPLAISRALVDAAGDALADQTIANVHVGATNTAIIIVRRGLLAFVRTLPTGGQQLTAAVRQNLAEDEAQAERTKRLFSDLTGSYAYEGMPAEGLAATEDTSTFEASGDLGGAVDSVFEAAEGDVYGSLAEQASIDEAATQLEVDTSGHAFQLPPSQVAPAPPPPSAPPEAGRFTSPEIEKVKAQVYEAIAQPLLDLATEVRRSLDFYRRNHRNEDIDRVVLSGGTALIPGLAEFIGGEIGVPTEVANPFEHVVVDGSEVTAQYLRDVAPMLVVAAGLAMRDMFD